MQWAKSINCKLFEFIFLMLESTLKSTVYDQRCILLLQSNRYFPKSIGSNKLLLDCRDTIANVVTNLLQNIPSATVEYICCTIETKTEPLLSINLNVIIGFGYKYLKRAIQNARDAGQCRVCNKVRSLKINLNNHLLINTKKCGNEYLSNIPPGFKLEGKIYYLRGVCHYQDPETEEDIGHYIAFCRRSDGTWECYDDSQTHPFDVNFDKIVEPHLLVYSS